MGRDNPRGCQCTIPATTHTHPFLGDVRVLYPGDRPGYLNHVATCKADVEVVLNRRVDLYHFVNGLRFHLRAAEETLAKFDGKFDSDDAQRARRHFGGRDV